MDEPISELMDELDLQPPVLRHMPAANGQRRGDHGDTVVEPIYDDEQPVYRSLACLASDEVDLTAFDQVEGEMTWRSLSWAAEMDLAECPCPLNEAASLRPQLPALGFVSDLPSDIFDHVLCQMAPHPGARPFAAHPPGWARGSSILVA